MANSGKPARDGETLSAADTAQLIRMLGLERDDTRNGWWLPAEPAPVFCTSIPHAVAESQRLADNDHERAIAALRAGLADAERFIGAIQAELDADVVDGGMVCDSIQALLNRRAARAASGKET